MQLRPFVEKKWFCIFLWVNMMPACQFICLSFYSLLPLANLFAEEHLTGLAFELAVAARSFIWVGYIHLSCSKRPKLVVNLARRTILIKWGWHLWKCEIDHGVWGWHKWWGWTCPLRRAPLRWWRWWWWWGWTCPLRRAPLRTAYTRSSVAGPAWRRPLRRTCDVSVIYVEEEEENVD